MALYPGQSGAGTAHEHRGVRVIPGQRQPGRKGGGVTRVLILTTSDLDEYAYENGTIRPGSRSGRPGGG